MGDSPVVSVRRALLGLGLALAATGCGTYSRVCPRVATSAGRPAASSPDVAFVKFLGVGGFLIEYDGHAVLTAPLYSNPTMGELATQVLHTDQRLVDALLPDVSGVEAILSGHSHFDHLMDVPYVALRKATHAQVYGNDDMTRLLAPLAGPGGGLRDRLVSLEGLARHEVEGLRCLDRCPGVTAFQAVSEHVRVWPILSEHSSQFKVPLVPGPPVHLWRGSLLGPASELPRTAGEWVEGTTLAYLIDFLDRSREHVALRVYYQDSGSREPYGFPPKCLLAERGVDLALLTVGGAPWVPGHPQAIVGALSPGLVMAGHWEDFFNPRELPLPAGSCTPADRCCETIRGIPLQSPASFLRGLRSAVRSDARFVLPCPDAWARLERSDGGAWSLDASSERWTPGTAPPRP